MNTMLETDLISHRMTLYCPPMQVSGVSEPMFRAGLDIVRKEGVMALYNGLTPSLIRTFPATGALFFAYEYSKKLMQQL